jgi:hypothetical protein
MRKNLGLIALALALPVVGACKAPGERHQRMEGTEQPGPSGETRREQRAPVEQQKPGEQQQQQAPMGDGTNTF